MPKLSSMDLGKQPVGAATIGSHGEAAAPAAPVPLHGLRPRAVIQVHADIEHMLKSRAMGNGTMARKFEDAAKSAGARAWQGMRKHSWASVAGTATAAWLAADLVGVGELTLVLGVGYAAYQVFRKGLPIEEALTKARM